MDLRNTHIRSTRSFFFPMMSEQGHFLHRIKFENEGKACECPSNILSEFLFAEYQFRVAAQIKDNYKEGHENGSVLCQVNTKYALLEKNLYFKEYALPKTLDSMRDFPFKDRSWYLRGTLKDHCSRSGGCCRQTCGCCEERLTHLHKSGLSGHCTWACPCCMARNGVIFKDDKEGLIIENQYQAALESDNPVFLLRLVYAYFAKPKVQRNIDQDHEYDSTGNVQPQNEEPVPNDDNSATRTRNQDHGADNNMFDSYPPPYQEITKSDEDSPHREGGLWARKIWPFKKR